MKALLMSLVAVFCVVATAAPTPTPTPKEMAISLKNRLSPAVLLMKDVHAMGSKACENDPSLYCIQIYASTNDAVSALETLFPAGEKLRGSNVEVEVIKEPSPINHPKASGGN